MQNSNRRGDFRVNLQMFLNEHVADKAFRCMSTNISSRGLFINRLLQPQPRERPVVGLEFELPGTGEVIWARGEIRRDRRDRYFHGTGVEFTGMARLHQQMIRDYVYELRERRLRDLLARIRRNRSH